MLTLRIFRKHNRYALLAGPYADGELQGPAAGRFEAHLAACARCTRQVQFARSVKSAIATLPNVAPSRSFQLTPAMVARTSGTADPSTRPYRLPMYLAVARVAAGLGVVAFVGVFTLSLLAETDSSDTAGKADTPLRESFTAADASGGAASPQAGLDNDAAPRAPGLAPATSGGVQGQAVVSPIASGASPADRNATPAAPPSAASDMADSRMGEAGAPGVDGASTSYAAGPEGREGDGFPWVIAAGSIAGAMVGVLFVLERGRRKRL